MNVHACVPVPAEKATVSPDSTLMYFIPGLTVKVRAASDTGAGEPKSNAVLFTSG
jgi:hypothetical protein